MVAAFTASAAISSLTMVPSKISVVVMASSAIFAFVIALSAIVNVTSFKVELAPPVTSISLDIILPSPTISVGSTVTVYSVLFPVTDDVTSIPVPSTTVVVV